MANPFKEADKARKKPAGNPKPHVEKEEVVTDSIVEEDKVAPVAVSEVKEDQAEKKEAVKEVKETPKAKGEKTAMKKPNLLAGLNPEKEKEEFGTQAFYLSKKNIEKLKKVAEKEGVSVSKLMNYIISEVL